MSAGELPFGTEGLLAYAGLALVAFLAGSIIPAASEAALAALIAVGGSPWLGVLVATVANTAGAATLFALGRAGGKWLRPRNDRQRARLDEARDWVRRHGAPVVFFSWVPIVGDPLVIAAGLLGVRWPSFVLFAATGKGLRYALVAIAAASLV